MSRNQPLEDLLQALYDLDNCPADHRQELTRRLDSILRTCMVLGRCTRDEVLGSVESVYREYRRDRRKSERLMVVRSATRLQ